MEELAIWLLAAYGCSSLLVVLANRWTNRMSSGADLPHEHYRLLVHDSEQVLERVVRRLLFRSFWSGKPIRISLLDDGSIDDTAYIATVFERYPYCCLDAGQEGVAQTVITIDLRSTHEKERA